MLALNAAASLKTVVFGRRKKKKGQMWRPNKNNKGPPLSTIGKERRTFIHPCHTWHVPLADIRVERGSTIKGCCVWEEEEESVRCEMDQIKTTKNHHYQQLARQDLQPARFVTLDTSHLLMSALKEVAIAKAGCVWEKKEERVRCENG